MRAPLGIPFASTAMYVGTEWTPRLAVTLPSKSNSTIPSLSGFALLRTDIVTTGRLVLLATLVATGKLVLQYSQLGDQKVSKKGWFSKMLEEKNGPLGVGSASRDRMEPEETTGV